MADVPETRVLSTRGARGRYRARVRILSMPARCRLVVCDVGGARDVRATLERTGRHILATRRQTGVLAFGSDRDVRSAFDTCGIRAFDVHAIHTRLLPFEAAERELLYDALARALARESPLVDCQHRRGHTLTCDLSHVDDGCFDDLRSVVGALGGTVPGTGITWSEAVRLKLWCDRDQAHAMLEPAIWLHPFSEALDNETARAFVHARTITRTGRRHQRIVQAWSRVLTNNGHACECRAFGITDGVDAVFELAS
jgi:hypothetical protein